MMLCSGFLEVQVLRRLEIFLQSVSAPTDDTYLLYQGLIFCLLQTLSFIVKSLILIFIGIFSARASNYIATISFSAILSRDYESIESNDSSRYINTLTTQSDKLTATIELTLNVVNSSIIFISILIALLLNSFAITIAIFAAISIMYSLVLFSSRKKLVELSFSNSRLSGLLVKTLKDSFSLIANIKSSNHSTFYVDNYSFQNSSYRQGLAYGKILSLLPKNILEFLASLILVGIIAYSAVNTNILIVPLMGAFALGLQRLAPAAQTIYNSVAEMQCFKASCLEIIQIANSKSTMYNPQIDNPMPIGIEFLANLCRLEVIDMKISMNSGKTLTIPYFSGEPGDVIAVIGSTGSGKSSFVKSLIGFRSFDYGEIIFGNYTYKVHGKSTHIWNSLFSYCPQNNHMIDASIMDNILLSQKNNFELMQLAKQYSKVCLASEFIDDLPNNYGELIGENGSRLSGGQAQRLGIIRTLVENKPIIILDESTSALDPSTELQIIENLRSHIGKSMMIIMVTHRYSNLPFFDKVYGISSDGVMIDKTAQFDH